MKSFYLGTSGYNYASWKGIFYPPDVPQKQWMQFYAQHYNSLEINATFYRSFQKKVYESWRTKVPDNFRFAIKGTRYVTHVKRLKNIRDSVSIFFEQVSGLENKLGVVLWQFPASFKCTDETRERLIQFFAYLPRSSRQVVELRDTSWFNQEVYAILQAHNCGWVINETSAFPVKEVVTSDFVYIRFHGPTSLYASGYTDQQLQEWATKIQKYLQTHDVYCYFNNDVHGHAFKNSMTLKNLVET